MQYDNEFTDESFGNAPRHSFRKDRMADNIHLPKNNYGHTVLNGKTQQEIDEEKVKVTFDAGGHRTVNMDIFDSAVMKRYLDENMNSDVVSAFAPTPSSKSDDSVQSNKLSVIECKTIQDFDQATKAYLRGEDPSAALASLGVLDEDIPVVPKSIINPEYVTTHTHTDSFVAVPIVADIAQPGRYAQVESAQQAEALRVCYNCHASVNSTSKFCSECGSSLPPILTKFCTECGYSYQKQEKFCPECGQKR